MSESDSSMQGSTNDAVIEKTIDTNICNRAICNAWWLFPVFVIFDQITKFYASALLVYHQPVAVIPSLNFTLSYNKGAAFSFLHDAGGWQVLFFITVAVVMSVILLIMLYLAPRKDLQYSIALWLVLSGAVGNLIDRIRIEKVVDFIDFYVADWHFATFNVADIAISIGAFLLILDAFNLYIFKRRKN